MFYYKNRVPTIILYVVKWIRMFLILLISFSFSNIYKIVESKFYDWIFT